MSYDISSKLASCDHFQSFDRMVVDWQDFRTLHAASNVDINMRAPINGKSVVKLYIGGQLVSSNHRVYGYTITPDINRIQTSDKFYKIQFNKPVRWYTPLIEVSYITIKNYCLKCGTTGNLNDLKPSSNGSVTHIFGTDKLVQRVLKMILTSKCPFYPQFVCLIKNYVGKKYGVTITDADVSNQVMAALQNLKGIQSAQRTIQSLDPQEMLKDVQNLQTITIDPTSIAISASVTSYGNNSNATPLSISLTSSSQLVGN